MGPPAWKVEWNDSMSVDIPEIDQDHRHFIGLANDLNHAIMDRLPAEQIRARLQVIVDDARAHFAHEEKMFREGHYPDAEEHARKHADVLESLQALQDRLVPYDMPGEWVSVWLEAKDLLINHLLTEDMKYAEYFRSQHWPPAAPAS